MRFAAIAIGAVALAVLAIEPALAAAQKAPAWRETWDLAWRIANFLILAFLIYKLGKTPMKEFLTGQRAALAEEIEATEKAKAEAEAELNNVRQMTANIEAELLDYEKALAEVAQRQRDESLEQAQNEANAVMQRAEAQADQAILSARKALAAEMLEEATEIAAQQLQKAITAEDRQRFVDQFAGQVEQAKAL